MSKRLEATISQPLLLVKALREMRAALVDEGNLNQYSQGMADGFNIAAKLVDSYIDKKWEDA